jgi:hypothetical protein
MSLCVALNFDSHLVIIVAFDFFLYFTPTL